MKIDIARFRDTFFEEAAEHLERLEAGLLRLEDAAHDPELLNDIFRCAHSIKGGSGTFGFTDIATFTHALESVLDRVRAEKLAVSERLVAVLLRSGDVLKSLLVSARSDAPAPPEAAEVIGELQSFLGAETAVASEGAAARAAASAETGRADYQVTFAAGEDLFRQGMDPLLLLRDLAELGDVSALTMDLSRLPTLQELDAESCYLTWSMNLSTTRTERDILDVFAFVEDSCRIHVCRSVNTQAARPDGNKPAHDRRTGVDRRNPSALESSSIRVPVEKVDRLVDLVGEVVISQSMLVQALNDFSMAKLPLVLAAAAELERNTRDLQERVMRIRMVPVANTFARFPRLVHDLAAAAGKKVTLEISGGETELDKGVVEQMADPLTHLIRNAVDHGIEAPADRLAAGKPEHGTVKLNAYYQGGSVMVEVSDDGRGLDTGRIREKAIEQNWIRPEDTLSDDQIHALIFHAGLSTAATVTDVSGRGVGMDVVKRNIESLNGAIAIRSAPGSGTRFGVKLPLTMAILDGLQLAVGDETYVVPLLAIVESFRPAKADVRSVFGRGEVVIVRGEALPLVRLHRLLRVAPKYTEACDALVVLVEHEGQRYGLLVDELLGQSQVVIKNIESNYGKVEGVTGATILGDGRVAFILDIQGLLRLFASDQRGGAVAA